MTIKSILCDPRFFPSVLIALDLCAAARYAFSDGDWRKTVYWISAAVLTTTVTF